MDVFRFFSSDLFACGDYLVGNEINRESYPVAQPDQSAAQPSATNKKAGKRIIVRTRKLGGGPGVIKARTIKPSRKKVSPSEEIE